MRLLRTDLERLAGAGVDVEAAFRRGLHALGERPQDERLHAREETAQGVAELEHRYAALMADLRLLDYALASREPAYRGSAEHYDAVNEDMRELERSVVPALRGELRRLRAREQELEERLRARGLDPDGIGPMVAPGKAIDPSPKPGEGEVDDRLELVRRVARPLPQRRSLVQRLLRRP